MTVNIIFGLVAAYVVIAILLLSLNLFSRWHWWVKAAAIIVTAGFFIGSYVFTSRLLGWPTNTQFPPHFQVLWASVDEPNKFTGDKGAIFFWVEELDQYNIPLGTPRAHELPYSEQLAGAVVRITDKIQAGLEVSGTADISEEQKSASRDALQELEAPEELTRGQFDVDVFPDKEQILQFDEMPTPVLPEKNAIGQVSNM